ncbi:hypothetical protein V6N13_090949 [Hibiscus sabdariffa]|uniref:Uncharacterized protein n=1 Tax=Hibiscus sabdariffa TaxID=183260 RepID=A0ABR2PCC5_9ROSI
MVATSCESEEVWAESSGRVEGAMRVRWPKRRPSASAGEEERRWIMEARVGPEMANLCNTRSSMTGRGG